MSPALIDGFFTSSATGKSHYLPSILIFIKTRFKSFVLLIQKIHVKWMLLKFQCKVIEARAHLAQGQEVRNLKPSDGCIFLFSYTIYLSLGLFPLNKYFLILFFIGFPSESEISKMKQI